MKYDIQPCFQFPFIEDVKADGKFVTWDENNNMNNSFFCTRSLEKNKLDTLDIYYSLNKMILSYENYLLDTNIGIIDVNNPKLLKNKKRLIKLISDHEVKLQNLENKKKQLINKHEKKLKSIVMKDKHYIKLKQKLENMDMD